MQRVTTSKREQLIRTPGWKETLVPRSSADQWPMSLTVLPAVMNAMLPLEASFWVSGIRSNFTQSHRMG